MHRPKAVGKMRTGREEVQWRYNGVHSMYNMHLYENVTKYKPILKEIK